MRVAVGRSARSVRAYVISLGAALAVAALFGFAALWVWDATVDSGPTAATLDGARVFLLAATVGFAVGALLAGVVPAWWQRRRGRSRAAF